MSKLRFKAVETASCRKPVEVQLRKEKTSEYFGQKVFDKK